jgi:hypothetical protein
MMSFVGIRSMDQKASTLKVLASVLTFSVRRDMDVIGVEQVNIVPQACLEAKFREIVSQILPMQRCGAECFMLNRREL